MARPRKSKAVATYELIKEYMVDPEQTYLNKSAWYILKIPSRKALKGVTSKKLECSRCYHPLVEGCYGLLSYYTGTETLRLWCPPCSRRWLTKFAQSTTLSAREAGLKDRYEELLDEGYLEKGCAGCKNAPVCMTRAIAEDLGGE